MGCVKLKFAQAFCLGILTLRAVRAVEKGKCRHARAERWRPRPAHRISVDDGGLNGLP
jgi:hypothetical protein